MPKVIKSSLIKYNALLKSLRDDIKNNINNEKSLDSKLNYLQNIQASNDNEKKVLENAITQILTIKSNLLHLIERYPDKLKLIPKELTFHEIYLNAVQKKGDTLRFVNSDVLNEELYSKICLAAVQNNSIALEFVNPGKLSSKDYVSICLTAWDKDHTQSFSNETLEKLIKNEEITRHLIKANYGIFDKLSQSFQNIITEIKEKISDNCHTIIIKIDHNYEVEDAYRIYAVKHITANPICVRTKEQLQELLSYLRLSWTKTGTFKTVNIVIIGHAHLYAEEIASFSPKDMVELKINNPFIKQFTLLGCNTAGGNEILSTERKKVDKLKKETATHLLSLYPELHKSNLRLNKLVMAILTNDHTFFRCGFAIVNQKLDAPILKKQLLDILDSAYFIVRNTDNSSYSMYYVHRDIEGTQCISISNSISDIQIEEIKKLDLTISTKQKNGYRLKDKQSITQKDYDSLDDKHRAEIQNKFLRNKKGNPVPNFILVKKSIFDSTDTMVWAQNSKGNVAILDDQLINSIIGCKRSIEFKERTYSKKEDNQEKPIYAQHTTISSESKDFLKLGENLATKVVKAMQEAKLNDITIKGYRNPLYPSPSEKHPGTGRLYVASFRDSFKEVYLHSFFGSGKTNLKIENLPQAQKEAVEEGRSKAVKIQIP